MQMNVYEIYRWLLLLVTFYNIVNVFLSILEYKQYYDKVPLKLRQYLQQKTIRILGDKILENRSEIQINLGLLFILIGLNIILFFI